MEGVVLVNEKDEFLGVMEKNQAHELGVLHRAFSIFLFNEKNELLLQQRAKSKYHSPELWTNSCCSHPRINESYLEAANRRLQEELGISCELQEKFHFIYKAKVGENLWEHELDYVFVGKITEKPIIFNEDEVMAVKWIKIETLQQQMNLHPENYTEWFKIILKEYLKEIENG